MKKLLYLYITFLLLTCFLWACGIKGPLIAPVVKLPQKAAALETIQRGEYLLLMWNNPDTYTDGSALSEIGSIEIWMLEEKIEGETSDAKISKERFLQEASLHTAVTPEELVKAAQEQISGRKTEEEKEPDEQKAAEEVKEKATDSIEESTSPEKMIYYYKLEPGEIKNKKYSFALKVLDKKEKSSEFTEPVSTSTKIVPNPPAELKAKVFADRIELNWTPPEKNIDDSAPPIIEGYNVYRLNEEGNPERQNQMLLTPRNTYSISQFEFGETYHYFIRASATRYPFYESGDSEIVKIEAKDVFPPAAPEGLVSIEGDNYVSLTWEVNKEKDTAGYKVWRREEGKKQYELLTPDPITETVFNDQKIEKKAVYFYAVSALDMNDNESKRSEDLKVTIGNFMP